MNQIVFIWQEAPGGWSSSNPAALWYQPQWNPDTMANAVAEVTDPSSADFGINVELGVKANPHALVTSYEIRYKESSSEVWNAWTMLDGSNVVNWQESEYTGGIASAWYGDQGSHWNQVGNPPAEPAMLAYRLQGLTASTSYDIQMRSNCTNTNSIPQPFGGDTYDAFTTSTAAAVTIGCMDPTACNYDATVYREWHDSCDYASCLIYGCMDPTAVNYDPTANADDGSCIACANGCMDSAAFNFDAAATCDDGSCIAVILGCTDISAVNYGVDENGIALQELPNTDDGSCCYVGGCNHPEAFNYNPLVCYNDGSCDFVAIEGCIDPLAANFVFGDANTAGTIPSGDACFPGYQEELYTGIVGDDANWSSSNNVLVSEDDGAVKIENQGGVTYGHQIYLKSASGEFSENLIIGNNYIVQFDARVGTGDNVKMKANLTGTQVNSAPITYDGYHPSLFANNGYYYETHTINFVADHANNNSFSTTSLNIGETIWIKNISLKQQNVITNVISIDFPAGNGGDGEYFHFDENVMSEMLEIVDVPANNSWSGTVINISQWRANDEIWTGNIIMWGSEVGNSEFTGWSGGTPPGHGRKDSGSAAGDWQSGDQIRIIIP